MPHAGSYNDLERTLLLTFSRMGKRLCMFELPLLSFKSDVGLPLSFLSRLTRHRLLTGFKQHTPPLSLLSDRNATSPTQNDKLYPAETSPGS